MWTGSNNSGTVYYLERDTTYHYVVRAYAGTQESADSAEVSYTAPSPEPSTYTIAATAGNHGAISPGGTIKVTKDSSQTFTITPDSGYHVVDVKVDGLSKGPISSYTFSQVNVNHSIAVTFAIDTYTISAAAGANGNINPGGSTRVAYGTSKSYTITPVIGHHIANVSVDGVSKGVVNTYTFEQIKTDHTIRATFAAERFAIIATAGSNGTITPEGAVDVLYGRSQTFTFTADPGYHIADVRVDGQSVDTAGSYTVVNVKADHSLAVTFSENSLVKISKEAEDGDLQWPMEIADDKNAGAGGYIWAPPGTGNFYRSSDADGYAEYHFDVPQSGDYFIWGRQISNDSTSDSFYVSLDGHSDIAWHTRLGDPETWVWDPVSLDKAHPEPFRLVSGKHTLRIKQREDGTKLDRILITNDPKVNFYDLVVSDSPDRSGAVLLGGSSVKENIYAYVTPMIDIKRVEFFIDGVLRQTENIAPDDLAGSAESGRAAPFDTRKLSKRSHTFSARITRSDGSRETITAEVFVE